MLQYLILVGTAETLLGSHTSKPYNPDIARVTEKVTVRVTDALTENEQKVLEILRKNPSATYIEMANQMNISRKAVSQKIKQRKGKGFILRVGSTKNGYWKLL